MTLGKSTILALLGTVLLTAGLIRTLSAAAPGEAYAVHEWGTFTTVSGSDGVLLPGLHRAEERLPPFVYSHAGMGNEGGKGWSREIEGVTVRMETPVLYFYSEQPRRVSVEVGFRGGSISQWYPQRSGGEQPPPFETGPSGAPRAAALDFAAQPGYEGAISWDVDVLARGAGGVADVFQGTETLAWEYPRQVASNLVRNDEGETEHYLFYRGVGNVDLPLRVFADHARVYVENLGAETIPFLLLFDQPGWAPTFEQTLPTGITRADGFLPESRVRFLAIEPLGPFESRSIERSQAERSMDWQGPVFGAVRDALVEAGLYRDEAEAMVRTWWHSYFETEGLRLFWIVPRAETDRVLPLEITPRPEALERVLVGRSEILTPAFERQLRQELRGDDHRWNGHRFEEAYRARVARMAGEER